MKNKFEKVLNWRHLSFKCNKQNSKKFLNGLKKVLCDALKIFLQSVLTFDVGLEKRRGTKKTTCPKRPANKLIARGANLK